MTHVRPAAVAGLFYPADRRELEALVGRLVDAAAAAAPPDSSAPKAIIAPHAGYVYSGPVAAVAYARLRPIADRIRRVVLIGPCHRVAVRGLALSTADVFETPLGRVPVDREAVSALRGLRQVTVFDATHQAEHSLEVHLPFLQHLLGHFTVVPLVVGDATAEEVAEAIETLWGGDETLIVVSSDLSHYLDYDSARRSDIETCGAIERLQPDAIGVGQACGRIPVGGLLVAAKRHGLHAVTLDLRNSGDTAGDRRRVVGYGAWLFTRPADATKRVDTDSADARATPGADPFAAATRHLLDEHGVTLLHLAATSIEHGLACGKPLAVEAADYPPPLREQRACFVTLTSAGRLRGCVGSPMPCRPLSVDVAVNAFNAAFGDTRFPKLTRNERENLDVSVSVLSTPQPMTVQGEANLLAQLRPGEDGLIIESRGRRALFLPQVWASLPQPDVFLGQLKVKAGLPQQHWDDDFRCWRFSSVSVSSATLPDRASLWV